jgi:hypothetical protein
MKIGNTKIEAKSLRAEGRRLALCGSIQKKTTRQNIQSQLPASRRILLSCKEIFIGKLEGYWLSPTLSIDNATSFFATFLLAASHRIKKLAVVS